MKRLRRVEEGEQVGPWTWFIFRLAQYWRWPLLATAFLAATSALGQCDPLILRWLIDTVLPGRNPRSVVVAGVVILVVQCFRLLTLSGSIYAATQCGQKLGAGLRSEIFQSTGNIPAEMLEGTRAGEIQYSLEQDIDSVMWLGSETLPSLGRVGITAALSIVMMWHLDLRLTLISCATIPFSIALGWYSKSALKRFAEASRAAAVERSSFSSEILPASIQIRILHAFPHICQIYETCVHEGVRALLTERRMQIIYSISGLFLAIAASSLMLEVGGLAVVNNRLSLGSYIAFYTYLLRLFEPINVAVDLYTRMQHSVVSIERLKRLCHTKSSFQSPSLQIPAMKHAGAILDCETLTCLNMSFSYSNGHRGVGGMTFTVRRGGRLLLDGATGAGKSTMLKAIAGVYSSYEGSILIDELDIRRAAADVTTLFGFVTQHPVLFSGTLLENLTLGSPAATSAEIDKALFISCADLLVARLPGALNYRVSQGGNGLSGGERQRIALARTILQNRPVLLMDEALSGLDEKMKEELLRRLLNYTEDKITIFASHDRMCKLWATEIAPIPARVELDHVLA